MDERSLLKLAKKTDSVEKQLLGQLVLAHNENDLLAFAQTYVSNYLPVLAYAVRHFETEHVAELMNSSILIDHLLSIRLNDVARLHIRAGVQASIDAGALKDRDSIARLLNNLSTVARIQLSSSILFLFSLLRGSLFALYCDNKLYLNYGIGWNNLLYHFLDSPHLVILLDEMDLTLAEEQVRLLESDLVAADGRLEAEVNDALVRRGICAADAAQRVPKHFLGLKYDWLQSRMLISYCRYLKTGNVDELTKAAHYCNIILQSLDSTDPSYDAMSFRRKLSFPGPSSRLADLIGDLGQYRRICRVFNYGAYFETEERCFVVMFPTSLAFYYSHEQLINGERPILEDEEFVLAHHRGGCFTLLDYMKQMVAPSESAFASKIRKCQAVFAEHANHGLSSSFVFEQLKGAQLGDHVVKQFEQKTVRAKAIVNATALSVVAMFNYFGEARGFARIPDYVNVTIPLVTELVVNALYRSGLEDAVLEANRGGADEPAFFGLGEGDECRSLEELEKDIECLEDATRDIVGFLNVAGLKDVLETNARVMALIKSPRTVEEINRELREMYGTHEKEDGQTPGGE